MRLLLALMLASTAPLLSVLTYSWWPYLLLPVTVGAAIAMVSRA